MYITIKGITEALGGVERPKYAWLADTPHRFVQPPFGRPFKLFALADALPAIRRERAEGLSAGEIQRLLAVAQTAEGGKVPGGYLKRLASGYPTALQAAEALLGCLNDDEAERFRLVQAAWQRGFQQIFWGRSHKVATGRLRTLLILDSAIFEHVFAARGDGTVIRLIDWQNLAAEHVAHYAAPNELRALATPPQQKELFYEETQ